MRFYANNMFTKDVRVFRKAVLHFRATDRGYQEQPVVFDFQRDIVIEYARTVIVPIPHRVGRFIKCDLYFDAKWMMISEVHIESGNGCPEVYVE